MSAVSESFRQNDDEIKHLLRQVVYMFYPHQCIVIMEAILFHNVLFEDDLIKLCCMHKKVFRSFCNKLVEDKLIVSHTQKEETQPYKLFTRVYYYVHNIEAIDSIKWKIHTIVKHVKEEIGNFSEPQGYICPTCHTKYTLLDAASLLTDDKLNFECSICGDYLIDDDISQEQKKGQEKLEKLMSLVEPIIKFLKIIDDLKIEDNNFESTLIKAVPAFSDSLALYSVSTKTSARRKKLENSNSNMSDASKRSQATIHVSITADDEDLRRERQKREERNRKLRQNALPSWHQESTVGKAALGKLGFEEIDEILPDEINTNNETNLDSETLVNSTTTTTNNNIPVKIENEADNLDVESSSDKVKIETSVKLELESESIKTNEINSTKLNPTSDSSIKLDSKSDSKNITSIITPTTSDGTTAEELDALSAYYSQLRQRQADEEEEEEDEDEEEDENIVDDIDMDDEDMDAFNQIDNDNDNENEDINNNGNIEQIKNNKQDTPNSDPNKADDSMNKEDIDEDDFDLEMFESDEE